MAQNDRQVAFRLPNSLVEEIDQYAAALTERSPGMNFTRADVVRMLLVRGLKAPETTEKTPEPTPKVSEPVYKNDSPYDSFETYRPWQSNASASLELHID